MRVFSKAILEAIGVVHLPIRRGRPACGDAKKTDIVDDLPPAHVEDGLVGLADEERTHGVEAGVTDGLAVFMGPFIRHQVGYFLDSCKNNNIFSRLNFKIFLADTNISPFLPKATRSDFFLKFNL